MRRKDSEKIDKERKEKGKSDISKLFNTILSVRVMRLLNLIPGDLLAVHGVPGIGDVGYHEGDEQGDVEHRAQGELAGAGVDHRQRRL